MSNATQRVVFGADLPAGTRVNKNVDNESNRCERAASGAGTKKRMIKRIGSNLGARMGKRGPQRMGFDAERRARIAPDLDAKLDRTADVVGVSKATLVRVALMELVGEYQDGLKPTRTTGLNRRRPT